MNVYKEKAGRATVSSKVEAWNKYQKCKPTISTKGSNSQEQNLVVNVLREQAINWKFHSSTGWTVPKWRLCHIVNAQ